jgi:uncharacterized protein (DUF779 family)
LRKAASGDEGFGGLQSRRVFDYRQGRQRMRDKVTATPAALELLAEIVADNGPVLFHQSGGCCDGSSPMCFRQGEFLIGDNDVNLGEIGGAPFYISRSQYETWKHTDLIIDVVPGRGGMFSLDNGRERRFLSRSEICAYRQVDAY